MGGKVLKVAHAKFCLAVWLMTARWGGSVGVASAHLPDSWQLTYSLADYEAAALATADVLAQREASQCVLGMDTNSQVRGPVDDIVGAATDQYCLPQGAIDRQ